MSAPPAARTTRATTVPVVDSLHLLSLLLAIIPIKQLSGYGYWGTIWRLIAAFIPFVILCLLSLLVGIIIIGYSVA